MKVRSGRVLSDKELPLYPTWFRWKSLKNKEILAAISTLYPTWFRWKVTYFGYGVGLVLVFISHMVQMKVLCDMLMKFPSMIFISHMVQMKALPMPRPSALAIALYPTWFRWKIFLEKWCKRNVASLYPTWFRWKLFSYSFSFDKARHLYIPHGSDESASKSKNFSLPTHLYIPHGSDERITLSALIFPFSSLYIPHGSDEREVEKNRLPSNLNFISHMVQMKGRW